MKRIKIKEMIFVFMVVLCIGSVQASWISEPDFNDGLSGGVGWQTPAIGYNVTGDDTWTMIFGDMFGNHYGFYWNDTSWVQDQSRVSGITNYDTLFVYSSPSLGYNVTGSGNWELILGVGSGIFKGYYWNGTSWVLDAGIVSGLGDVGDRATPTLAYNVTGENFWTLMSGEWSLDGYIYVNGFRFNGTSWVTDNDIITGLPSIQHVNRPHLMYNLTGDSNWNLIICDDAGATGGFYLEDSTWLSDTGIISGLSGIGSFPSIAVNYDIRSDEEWTLISADSDSNFLAYRFNSVPVISFLQTESQTNPDQLITNTSNPYFSWMYFDLDDDLQYSYEIKVGSSEGSSDMWNSGEVISSNDFVNYAGSDLEEVTNYYVQVRTNDGYDDSPWILGTFKLRDTIVYGQGSESNGESESVAVVEKEEVIEPISQTFTERIINILPETDSTMFVIYFIAAILGSLIYSVIVSQDSVVDIIFSGAIGWVIALVLLSINNVYSLVVLDTILKTLISVVSGFVIYGIYNQLENDKKK